MAVAELNAAGGVRVSKDTLTLVLVEQAYANRPGAAADAAKTLLAQGVVAIVGPQLSVHALEVAPLAEAAKVPMITPMATATGVTAGRRFVYRLAAVEQFAAGALAGYAADRLKLRRVAVLHDEAHPASRTFTDLFAQTFAGLGGQLVARETFARDGGLDFQPQLKRLLAESPDALLLPNYPVQDSAQMRQARALGFRGQFLGTDSWERVSLSRVPEANGAIALAQWDPRISRPATQRFVSAYEAKYGQRPRATAAATYDAIHLLAAAASRAGTLDGSAWASVIGKTERYTAPSRSIVSAAPAIPSAGRA